MRLGRHVTRDGDTKHHALSPLRTRHRALTTPCQLLRWRAASNDSILRRRHSQCRQSPGVRRYFVGRRVVPDHAPDLFRHTPATNLPPATSRNYLLHHQLEDAKAQHFYVPSVQILSTQYSSNCDCFTIITLPGVHSMADGGEWPVSECCGLWRREWGVGSGEVLGENLQVPVIACGVLASVASVASVFVRRADLLACLLTSHHARRLLVRCARSGFGATSSSWKARGSRTFPSQHMRCRHCARLCRALL